MSPRRSNAPSDDRHGGPGDTKVCVVCGRSIEWRRKWARDWPSVKYCSDACRRTKTDQTDAALERIIVDLLAARGPGTTICPSEAARAHDPEDWRDYMERTRRAARRLADRGFIEIMQGGTPVHDPSRTKGPIRLRLVSHPSG